MHMPELVLLLYLAVKAHTQIYRSVVEPTSNNVCDYKLCYTLLLNARVYHSLHKHSVFNRYQLECFINHYSKSHTHVIIFINGDNDKIYCFLPVADLIHVLSSVPRDLNFIDHTSNIGSKEYGPSDLENNISY